MTGDKSRSREMELLAPAGSLQSFFAAFENGADAVFCGLNSFSARAKAKNFSIEDLERLVGYSHQLNKKIYVALNTLIQESELPELITVLGALDSLSIDGVIIQDIGLYHLLRTHFSAIPIHASTQMVVHNLAGVRQLEKMGFERAVLARELSLQEIAYIGANCTIELEHFIHGALCYSISGHCLFSSYIDGRSGNRGRCTQPCRRRYHFTGKPGFHFSTSDFSALEHIPALSRAGIVSLKIEGRMKSAEYVASVVSAYRIVLDAEEGHEKEAVAIAREHLESAMGRTCSSGFLTGSGTKNIVLDKQKGGIGRIIGKVEALRASSVSFRISEALHVGDRLRIQPGNDRAGQGFTVRDIVLGKRHVKRAGKNSFVSIPLPVKIAIHPGDVVFKLSTGKSFTMSKESCGRRLRAAPVHGKKVQLFIDCSESTSLITVSATVAGLHVEREYSVEMIRAHTNPLNKEVLLKIFSHTGAPELQLSDLHCGELPLVVIKPSRLKAIRREFYTALSLMVNEELGEMKKRKMRRVYDAVFSQDASERPLAEDMLYVVSDNIPDLQIVHDYPMSHFIFTLTREFVAEVLGNPMDECDRRGITWDIPSIMFDGEWSSMRSLIKKLLRAGYSSYRLNNISHFELFDAADTVQLVSGPWLYALNSQSFAALEKLGCCSYSLSIEDDRDNVRLLMSAACSHNILLPVYGAIELFTSRIPFAAANETENVLHNDKGDRLFLKKRGGLTVTIAGKAYSLLGDLRELRAMGCRNFILDLRGAGLRTEAGQKVMGAYMNDELLPESMNLNFSRGLS